MLHNRGSVSSQIRYFGDLVKVTHYDRSSDIQYDADTEEPINPVNSIFETKAQFVTPSKELIQSSGGKITLDNKILKIPKNAGTIVIGDDIFFSGGTYRVSGLLNNNIVYRAIININKPV